MRYVHQDSQAGHERYDGLKVSVQLVAEQHAPGQSWPTRLNVKCAH